MLHNRLSKNNQGVTLIEVITVVAVLGVVMAAVTGFMISGTRMSAKVSGVAADSMQEQTAVEFINRRIWEVSEVTFPEGYDQPSTVDGVEVYTGLGVGNAILYTAEDYQSTGKSMVVYQNGDADPVALCPGTIYFQENENGTVTYYLNGEEHVVNLRVSKS